MLMLLAHFLAVSVALLALAVFLLISVVLLLMALRFNWRLWPTVRRARTEIRRVISGRCPGAEVFSIHGATNVDPRHLSFSIRTGTDQERDQLSADPLVYKELCGALHRARYPAAAIPFVHFVIQSQETVDRKFGGRWHEAMEYPEIG